MEIGVFISYNHADRRIAGALKQCLLALSPNLNVFIDHESLEAGDNYEEKLARYISKSQWFLLICSGPPRQERDMGWCFQEAGQFRAKLLNENKEDNVIRSRLVAIHDDDRPRPISHFQSVRITSSNRQGQILDLKQGSEDTSAFEDTDAFNLFKTIIERSAPEPLRDLADQDRTKLITGPGAPIDPGFRWKRGANIRYRRWSCSRAYRANCLRFPMMRWSHCPMTLR